MNNPFSMGKVVGVDFDSDKYHEMKGADRGHKDFVMSRSELMEFAHCPQRWLRGVEEEKKSWALEFGELVDCVITTPKEIKKRYALVPLEYVHPKDPPGQTRPWNFNADVCRKWREEQEERGRTVVKVAMMDKALVARERLKEDERISELIKKSENQVCITTLYTGSNGVIVPVKVLIDLLPGGKSEHIDCLADLKTARNAAPRPWQRTVFENDYYVQAAMYLDAYNSCPGFPARDRFLHVVVENVPPFETARRELSQDFIHLGRERYTAALEWYCRCLKAKKWPGFDDEGNDIVNGWRLVEPEAWMIL